MQEVTGSSPVSPTTDSTTADGRSFSFAAPLCCPGRLVSLRVDDVGHSGHPGDERAHAADPGGLEGRPERVADAHSLPERPLTPTLPLRVDAAWIPAANPNDRACASRTHASSGDAPMPIQRSGARRGSGLPSSRNAMSGPRPSTTSAESRDQAASPATTDDDSTTRERPANRPGFRPLARPQERDRRGHRERGWDRGRHRPLVLRQDERFRDS